MLFLFGIVRGFVRAAILTVLLLTAGGGYGYYRLALRSLPSAEGHVVTAGVCRATPSLTGATLGLTFEAYLKDEKGHNFLSSGGPAGLVRRRLEWSHGGFKWIEDAAFAERQADAEAERRRLARRPPGELIGDLRSPDAGRRELSAKQLRIMTGQTLGFRYDGPEPEREAAAKAWEKWWADDANKLRYRGREVLEGGQKALDVLRRALGEPGAGEGEGGR